MRGHGWRHMVGGRDRSCRSEEQCGATRVRARGGAFSFSTEIDQTPLTESGQEVTKQGGDC